MCAAMVVGLGPPDKGRACIYDEVSDLIRSEAIPIPWLSPRAVGCYLGVRKWGTSMHIIHSGRQVRDNGKERKEHLKSKR
jgi:hypothetical protein